MILDGVLKITFRDSKKNITSTLIKVIGLAVSVSAALIIWSYVANENRYDKGIPGSDRIYRLETNWASMPPFLGHALNLESTNQIISTRLNFWADIGVQVDNNPYTLKNLTFADSTFFKVFPLESISGDTEEALANPFSIVLSETISKRLFGSTDIIGKTIRFENQYDFTVTAIIRDQPYLHFNAEAIASLASLEEIRYKGVLKEYDGWSYPTFLLFPEEIRKEASDKAVMELFKKVGYNNTFTLRAFKEIYYSHEVENEANTKHGNLLYNKILIAVSVFILLLAAINFINLTIANAISRSKEVSHKKLQGAFRSQLIIQFLSETFLYIFISVLLSFITLWFISPLMHSITGYSVTIQYFSQKEYLFLFIPGLLLFILITGLYPSIYISSYNLNTARVLTAGHPGHTWIRNALIVFQNFISITLICCTLIANLQFSFMNKKELGFDKKNILILKLNSQLKDHMDLFREKLLYLPEISGLSYSSRIPGNYWGSWCCVNIEGSENKYFNNYVDPDYITTMGIKIKDGRNFSAISIADMKASYLINETAIKQYGLKNPIGQLIAPGNGVKGEIVGIIQDFHYRGLNYAQTPLLLFYTTDYKNYVNIRINSSNIPEALGKIKTVWDELCPAFSFEYTFLDETYDLQYKSERRFESLLFAFALLAVFIAGIGLFGLSIFSIERRTKEIGLRKVNGAKVTEILRMLNIEFIKWVGIAWLISCPVAWFVMKKWLMNFAYRTEISLWIFVYAGLIAVGIALITVSWQSWRAATRNPVEALRYE
jgi:putative ABC transport system permease protein